MPTPETDDEKIQRLLETADRLVAAVERKDAASGHGTMVKVDNRVDNRRSERAAWVAAVAATVAMTIAILQAFQIQVLQGKYDRMQDYLNYIYQQAPHLRQNEGTQ